MKKWLVLSIVLPMAGLGQTMDQVRGHQQLEDSWLGYRSKKEAIFDGINLYNKLEEIIWIDVHQPPTPANAYVSAHYIWAHYGSNGLNIDRHIAYVSGPTTRIQDWVHEYTNAPFNLPGKPELPATRIANEYTVVAGHTRWDYCRTTWQLRNPRGVSYVFTGFYLIGTRPEKAYFGFVVGPRTTSNVVIGVEYLKTYRDSDIIVLYPNDIAYGPYGIEATSSLQIQDPLLCTGAGYYYLPSIPTRRYILEHIESDYFER